LVFVPGWFAWRRVHARAGKAKRPAAVRTSAREAVGIDAPEKGQSCDDGHWPGPLGKKALEDFIAGRALTCKSSTTTLGRIATWRSALPGR
jgi:endonuclease YncB( thermonuclease family)